jgi:uncharacterized protein (TIGR03435 family)
MRQRVATATLIGLLMGAVKISAWQKPASIEFEVASVKPADPKLFGGGASRSVGGTKGRLEARNLSLKDLVMSAYHLNSNQVIGGPDWLDSAGWDISAKLPADTNQADVPQMIASLLESRFHLAIHRETRTLPAYLLVVAKSGSKLRESTATDGGMSAGPRMIRYSAVSMGTFAAQLSSLMQRQVIDQTGLKGKYEISLVFTPVQPNTGDDAVETGTSIFTAVQEQLGLRLQSDKRPVEVVVIDKVEKPSEN